MTAFSKVTRVEVIDGNGRSYVNLDAEGVSISKQDAGRTLKIFIGHTPNIDRTQIAALGEQDDA